MPLRRSEKRHCRRVARMVWIDSQNDIRVAEELFRKHYFSIDPATIELLVALAIQLWKWWRERQHAVPSEVASADEPGVELDEDE